MADNIGYTPGVGASVAADEIGGHLYQRVKPTFGDDGSATDVSTANPFPSAATGAPTGFWPGYVAPTTTDNKSLMFDEGGAAVVRAAVLTDEGTFRANFANTSLGVSLGSCTVAGDVVTGSGFSTAAVGLKDYFKFDADPDTAWTQILSINSDTEISLVSVYLGASSSGAASRAIVKPVVGSGGSVSVASGQCTIASGTTNNATTGILRKLDYLPIIFRAAVSVSQRIANQDILVTMQEDAATPRWFARIRMTGTTNTQIILETGRNPTGAPSASETEQVTVTLPDGLTTASVLEYTIELLAESCKFYVNNKAVREAKPILLAELSKVIPVQYDIVACGVLVVNGTGAASSTNVVADYITGQNHNNIKISAFSNTETFVAAPAPISEFTGSLTNLGTILTVDCSQFRQLSFSVQGTNAGTVQFEASDEPTFATAQSVPCVPAGGGAAVASTTTTTKAYFIAPVVLRYFRLRISAGATAQRTVIVQGYQQTTFTTSQTITTATSGAAAHDAVISGAPVRIGGRAISANYAAVATGDTADLVTTLAGALITRDNAIPENSWSYAAASGGITNTVDVAVKAAAAAGIRNYVTGISLSNNSATATEFVIKDGASTVLWRCHLPANASNVSIQFNPALRGTAATDINVACITTGTATYANLQGYIAP